MYSWIGVVCTLAFLLCVLYETYRVIIEIRKYRRLTSRLQDLAERAILSTPDNSSSEDRGRLGEELNKLQEDFANHDKKYPRT